MVFEIMMTESLI
nr:unnamed protein product [Callosobruchus chinensis]